MLTLKTKNRLFNFRGLVRGLAKWPWRHLKFRDEARPVFNKDWPPCSHNFNINPPVHSEVENESEENPTENIRSLNRWETDGGFVKKGKITISAVRTKP